VGSSLASYIILGWKKRSAANDLAYYDTALIAALKRFLGHAPDVSSAAILTDDGVI